MKNLNWKPSSADWFVTIYSKFFFFESKNKREFRAFFFRNLKSRMWTILIEWKKFQKTSKRRAKSWQKAVNRRRLSRKVNEQQRSWNDLYVNLFVTEVKKVMKLATTYTDLKNTGRLDAYLSKKRKRLASKTKKQMPTRRVENDDWKFVCFTVSLSLFYKEKEL